MDKSVLKPVLAPYFAGDKSAEKVAHIIQSRVELIHNEKKMNGIGIFMLYGTWAWHEEEHYCYLQIIIENNQTF